MSNFAIPSVALSTQQTRPKQDRRNEDRSHGILFARGYNDRLLREMLLAVVPDDGSSIRRSVAAEQIVENFPFKRAKAYHLLNDFIKRGWLVEVDRSTVKLNTQHGQIDEQTKRQVE